MSSVHQNLGTGYVNLFLEVSNPEHPTSTSPHPHTENVCPTKPAQPSHSASFRQARSIHQPSAPVDQTLTPRNISRGSSEVTGTCVGFSIFPELLLGLRRRFRFGCQSLSLSPHWSRRRHGDLGVQRPLHRRILDLFPGLAILDVSMKIFDSVPKLSFTSPWDWRVSPNQPTFRDCLGFDHFQYLFNEVSVVIHGWCPWGGTLEFPTSTWFNNRLPLICAKHTKYKVPKNKLAEGTNLKGARANLPAQPLGKRQAFSGSEECALWAR